MSAARQTAQELDDPFTLALTHYFGSVTQQTMGDKCGAAQNAALSLKIATEHGFMLPKVWSTGVLGWCSVAEGETRHGLALLDEAIEGLRATQSRHFMHYLLFLQADALLRAGQPDLAFASAEQGVALAKVSGESFYLAALYCLQAEIHRMMKRESKARLLLARSIELAHRQGAFGIEQKARGHLARA